MKQRILIVLLFLLIVNMALNAQVNLTATLGTTGGTYTTLGAAFAKINDGTHRGAITITLSANTTETSSAVLNASGSGSASYTSLNIYPTVSGVIVSCNRNSPLIDLNGADYVTIDGRVNATGLTVDMIIRNLSTAGDNYTSTIRFINGATNNIVKYCKIQGSTTHGASGILCFNTTTGVGNSNNTIDNNQITNANGNRPYNAIFSNGSNGAPNSSNTISNNNIYDVWNISWTHTYAINLSENNDGNVAYNTAWSITGNSFYQASEYALADYASQNINIIYINASSGTNFTISSNFIGGSEPLCGGSPWTKTFGNNSFTGISLSIGTGTASNIQGNTIKNFNYTNTGSNNWTGIAVGAGDVNIGTTAGNCIGASSGTGSIIFTADGYESTNLRGIHIFSSGIVHIQNNIIGSITSDKTNHQYQASIYGIYLQTNNSGSYSVTTNTIGSTTTANSINAISLSTDIDGYGIQTVAGILTEGNATNVPISISNNTVANLTNGTTNTDPTVQGWIYGIYIHQSINTVSGNTVHHLSIANANTSTGPVAGGDLKTPSLSAAGIAFADNSNTAQTITGNTIYSISNSYASFSGHVAGIYYWGQSTASTVEKNFIYDLSVSATSSSATVHGIKIGGGVATYSNNIINLGGNTATSLYGIYEAGSSGTSNIYFNTVYLTGAPIAGSLNSACLYNAGTSSTRDFRNNIFNNARSNNGAAGTHYAIYFSGTGGTLNCNYNDYWVSGTGGKLGYYGGDKTSLPIVTGVTGNDANSQSLLPGFANPGGTTANNYIPSTALPAVTGTGITTDFGGTTRSGSPEIGAWEQSNTLTWNGSSTQDWNTAVNWTPNLVPTASHNVIVPDGTDDLVVNQAMGTPAKCNNLTIEAGAKVVISAGKALTVNGTLTNSEGNGGLLIESDENGTGSLIQHSTSVGATIKRYLTGSSDPANQNMYHFVSIPTYYSNPLSGLFLGSYLYILDAAQTDPTNSNYYGKWVNLGDPTTTPLSIASGYMVFYPGASHTYTFTGNLNTGTFTPTVTFGGTYTFNLVPNPYPSAINWGASGGWLKSNIGATAWIWNSSAGNYTTLSGNSYVPAGQAFIVMASGTPVLTVDNNACVHNAQGYYKSNQENMLKISTQCNNFYDETYVGFNSSATPGFDLELDGFKLWGLEEAPQLWTEAAEFRMSLNQLPLPSGSLVVPLDFKTSYSGEVTLSFSGIESIDQSMPIRLEDKLNGSVTDLRQTGNYIFSHVPSNPEKRFNLIFGYPDGINATGTNDGKVWISGKSIFINPGNLSGEEGRLEIFDLLGQSLYSGSVKLDHLTSINPSVNGMVIVRLTAGGKTCTARGYLD